MRLLHTSDWHLGRTFHGSSLLQEQRLAMDRIVEAVTEHGVDAVLVPGDVYDRALPAVDVVALLDATLERIVAAGARVIMTSGNHDSAVRLGFGSGLLERAGVHLRTSLADLTRPVVLREDGQEVLVYGLPYLEPRLVADALGVEGSGHAPVIAAALERVREDAATRAGDVPTRVVVLAHVFAAGGEGSASERPLAVGEVDRVPATLFADVDYAALGHLHGAQSPLPTVRYAGSPLPYSFSETDQAKGALLVDLAPERDAEVTWLDWPAPRPLRRMRGDILTLLQDPLLAEAEEAWCQITLTDPERPERAMERLRERFPYAQVLLFDPQGRDEQAPKGYRERLREAADPTEVTLGFVDHVRGRGADAAETALLGELIATAGTEQGVGR